MTGDEKKFFDQLLIHSGISSFLSGHVMRCDENM